MGRSGSQEKARRSLRSIEPETAQVISAMGSMHYEGEMGWCPVEVRMRKQNEEAEGGNEAEAIKRLEDSLLVKGQHPASRAVVAKSEKQQRRREQWWSGNKSWRRASCYKQRGRRREKQYEINKYQKNSQTGV